MSAILYPIANSPAQALEQPVGRAARESDAQRLAGEAVSFVREFVGQPFRDEEEARRVWAARLDGPGSGLQPEDRFCDLKPIIQRSRVPFVAPHSVWRLSVGYWKIGAVVNPKADLPQARAARRTRKGDLPDTAALGALAHQPLRPIKPQQPLDIGLFEVPMPEDPQRLIPDE